MDVATVLACSVNVVVLLAQMGSFYAWRGQVTEALARLRRDVDELEDDLRAGGCPAFGQFSRRSRRDAT